MAIFHGEMKTICLQEFMMEGHGSAGTHCCFIIPLHGGDVKALLQSHDNTLLLLPLAKCIILHLLYGIASAHGRHVVHTNLKVDNILFTTAATTEEIDRWIKEDPPCRKLLEMSSDGIVQSAVSQPLKLLSEKKALWATYILSNFRYVITPSQPSSFEHLKYSLVGNGTNQWIYGLSTNEIYGLSEMGNLLYQMIVKTGESFCMAQLKTWPLAIKYFHPENCCLQSNPLIFDYGIKYNIGQLKIMLNFVNEIVAMDLLFHVSPYYHHFDQT
ncbi:hypothetical protein BDN71DRAFT_1430595 [Pleurotus eryngii]|uniref:Protein kinase domain-containing protein n=1 Tax=Pleurotus eryngii TaxID=5323 RepID=A0A9P5ZYB6_PLEER|nr:hypothetical protein BDN71DRAFT_1430595 [Pleurotus eryngii]